MTAPRLLRMVRVHFKRSFTGSKRKSRGVLAISLVLILLWQADFAAHPGMIENKFASNAATGMRYEGRFFYFLYYLGLYPIASLDPYTDYSEAGARFLIEHHGDRLVQDMDITFRSGDRGRILLYYPDALMKGSARDPSLRPMNRIVFVIALCGLFFSFWHIGLPLLGALSVLILGSDPLQLYAVHVQENIHCWTITTAILLLALHLPLLRQRPPGRYLPWIAAMVTGFMIASIRNIRSEPVPLILSAVMVYLTLVSTSRRVRWSLVALLFVCYGAAASAWNIWLEGKFERAQEVLRQNGGHPFPGPYVRYHDVWHPLWCGLGDFDSTYGYTWDDDSAVAYATPILARRYGVHVRDDAWWDTEKIYPLYTWEFPHYQEVVRDKVLHDITHDPLWYVGILFQRIIRLQSVLTPPRIQIESRHMDIPLQGGILLVPLLLALAAMRCWMGVKLFIFPLACSLTSIIVYSGHYTTYYAIYHLMITAWLLSVAGGVLRRGISRRVMSAFSRLQT